MAKKHEAACELAAAIARGDRYKALAAGAGLKVSGAAANVQHSQVDGAGPAAKEIIDLSND